MEYVRGPTLDQVSASMEAVDRAAICCDFCEVFDHLRRLEQHPQDKFVGKRALHNLRITCFCIQLYSIGNITRAPLYDRAFHMNYMSEAGSFTTVREFHNWVMFLHRRPMPDPRSLPVND
jgi:hypothetical protein